MKAKKLAMVLGFTVMITVTGCSKTTETMEKNDVGNTYPEKAITLVVPASAGGDTDLRARLVARYLEKELGQSVTVSNVAGGATSVASIKVKEAAPDGYAILFNHNSMLTNKLFGTTDFSYDDFSIIGSMFRVGNAGLITHKNAAAKTFDDVVNQIKTNPKSINYATETGGNSYLYVLALQKALGIEFNIVDAGDASQRTSAMLGGHIDIMQSNLNNMEEYFKSGDLVPLVCISSGNDLEIENVSTMTELGYDFEWPDAVYAFYMPDGTPEDIVKKVEGALEKVSENEDYLKEAETMKASPYFMNAEDTKKFYDGANEVYFSFEDVVKESMQ